MKKTNGGTKGRLAAWWAAAVWASGALAAAAGAAGATGCGGPGAAYRAAVAADSSERYRAFLYEYPHGEYSAEIEARLEDRMFRDLKDAHESGDLGSTLLLSLADNYLEAYPAGKRRALVEKLRAEVEDETRMLELCPLPLLDEVRGAAEKITPLIASRCLWFFPGELRYTRVLHPAPTPADRVVSADVAVSRKFGMPPIDVYVAQIKDGSEIVVGFEAHGDARAGGWMLQGKVRMVTAGALKKAEEAKGAGAKGAKPATLEIPFLVHVAIEAPAAPFDERDARLLVRAWTLYESKAAEREKERDLGGFCRSSRADLFERCARLTDEAAVWREARDRAAVTLREISSAPDDKARGVASAFFATNAEARKAARKAHPAPVVIPGFPMAPPATAAPAAPATATAAPVPATATAAAATAAPAPATAAPAPATAAPAPATGAPVSGHPKGTAAPKGKGTAAPKGKGSAAPKGKGTAAPAPATAAAPAGTAAPAPATAAATAAPAPVTAAPGTAAAATAAAPPATGAAVPGHAKGTAAPKGKGSAAPKGKGSAAPKASGAPGTATAAPATATAAAKTGAPVSGAAKGTAAPKGKGSAAPKGKGSAAAKTAAPAGKTAAP
ncbi:MAG TPA: hypothetical protein VG389_09265 [Myxococcota bacterium]|nr:hypothetical protein [Myxococcota bacterium]